MSVDIFIFVTFVFSVYRGRHSKLHFYNKILIKIMVIFKYHIGSLNLIPNLSLTIETCAI